MATIRTRSKADGSISYQAIIRLKCKGRIIHQETKSFSRQRLAEDWARRREVELEAPGAIAKAAAGAVSLGDLIEWYVKTYAAVGKWGRTKHADLKRLQAHSISETSAVDLTDQMLVDHITKRRAAGAGPATALNDLVWIGVVLHAAKEARGLPVDAEAAARARETCKRLKLVRRSRERDRLPTYDELQRLDEYFAASAARGREDIPMRQIMWFAIYSARRQEEITQIRRADDDAERMLGLVRDAKHPTDKDGNHRRFRYSPAAWHIAGAQPDGDRAFPFEPKSISARFTRACQLLGIEDLHFHDLRHEATTRLFEWGLSIPEVATYTLHESWNVLKRYTHVLTGRKVFDAPFLPHNVLVRPGGFVAPSKVAEPVRRRRTVATKKSRAKR